MMLRMAISSVLFCHKRFTVGSVRIRSIASERLHVYQQQRNVMSLTCATFLNCRSERSLKENRISQKYFRHTSVSSTNKLSSNKTIMQKLVNMAPSKFQPYLYLMRLDKPIGTWLLLCPSWWSIGMSASPGTFPDLYFLTLFGVGAVLTRGAGCTINDLWDRRFDAKVERTKNRPLVSGEVTPFGALTFLGLQLSLALLVLLQFNMYSIIVGICSIPLIVVYPLMKRITYWPQMFLGITFNWGVLLGWSAVRGACDWSVVLPLYAAGLCWTMIYDTIYAHQDRDDDVAIKLKSTAIMFGEDTKKWLMGFSASMVTCLAFSGINCNQTWPYYAAVGLTMFHLLYQIGTVNINNSQDCWNKFQSNKRIGLIIFAGIIAGTVLKTQDENKSESQNDNENKNRIN